MLAYPLPCKVKKSTRAQISCRMLVSFFRLIFVVPLAGSSAVMHFVNSITHLLYIPSRMLTFSILFALAVRFGTGLCSKSQPGNMAHGKDRYKIPDGKPANKFALNEQCMGRKYAMKVVEECHVSWRILVGKAEAGQDLPRNLSVSRLLGLAGDIELAGDKETEHMIALNAEDSVEPEEEGEEQYPTSLIA